MFIVFDIKSAQWAYLLPREYIYEMDKQQEIAEIINHILQGTRQTPNGSHLEEEVVQSDLSKSFSEELNKIAQLSKNISSRKEIEDEVKIFKKNLERFNVNADDALKMEKAYREDLKKTRKQQIDALKNFFSNQKEIERKYIEKRDKEASTNVWRTVSNGRNETVNRKGNSFQELGVSLNRVGRKQIRGGNALFGKAMKMAGKSALGFGTLLTKAAGPIGMFISILSTLNEIAKAYREYQIKEIELDTKADKAQNEFKLKGIELETGLLNSAVKIQQNNDNAAQSIVQANITYAQQAQAAATAMATQIGGIYADLAKEGKQIGYEAYATAHEIISSAPFDVKSTMYKAAETAIETAAKIETFKLNSKYGEKAKGIAQSKYSAEISAAAGVRDANIRKIEFDRAINEKLMAKEGVLNWLYGSKLAQQAYNAERTNLSIERQQNETNFKKQAAGTIDITGFSSEYFQHAELGLKKLSALNSQELQKEYYGIAIAQAVAQQKLVWDKAIGQHDMTQKAIDTMVKTANIEQHKAFQTATLDLKKLQYDTMKSIENSAIEAAKRIAQAQLKMAQSVNDVWLKAETSAYIMGREMGLTKKRLQDYSKQMGIVQMKLSNWGKDLEWIQKTQSAYQEKTGRNKELSTQDLETSAVFGMIVGDETITEYTSGMEIFNHSVEDSNKKLYTMFKEVSKIGLNGKKYAKDLAQNLKLAEKYNFKDGVNGLMRMSKWAQNMRFNVGSLEGMVDKVQQGGLEGIIQQAAEIQVLGGNFALGSDPLAMAYESFMDPEAYAKRMNGMLAGQGVFDSKTGEVSFGIAPQMLMRQFAQSTGQDYKEVLNQARTQVKLNQIDGLLDGKYTENQKALIANKAQYNTETGRWEVNTGNIDDQGNSIMKAIEDLTESELKMMENEESTNVEKLMLTQLKSIFATDEAMKRNQTMAFAYLQGKAWDDLRTTNQSVMDKIQAEFWANFEKYKTDLISNLGNMKSSIDNYYRLFTDGNKDVDGALKQLSETMKDMPGALNNVAAASNAYLDALKNTVIPQFKAQGVKLENNIEKIMEAMKIKSQILDIKKDPKTWFNHFKEQGWQTTLGSIKNSQNIIDHNQNMRYKGTLYKHGDEGYDELIEQRESMIKGAILAILKKITEGKLHLNHNILEPLLVKMDPSMQGRLDKSDNDQALSNQILRKYGLVEDGLVMKDGHVTRIDDQDQVLAAKNGGPLDKLIDMAQQNAKALPLPISNVLSVLESVSSKNNSNHENLNGKIDFSPLQINMQLNGNLNADLQQAISNDPNMIRALSQMISIEVEKKVHGGRVNSLMNRGIEWTA